MSATVRIVIDWEGTTIEIANTLPHPDLVTFSDGGTVSALDVAGMLDDAYRRATDAVLSKPEVKR